MKDVFVIDLRGNRAQGPRRSLKSLLRTEAVLQHVAKIIRHISRQPLRMHNEQVGFPLSEAAVHALERRAARRGAV